MTARLIVPFFTCGRIRVERIPEESDAHEVETRGAIRRRPDGILVLNGELAMLVGFLFWVAAGVVAYIGYRVAVS